MKSLKLKKVLLFIITFLFGIIISNTVFADTDVINDYTITITPRSNGTLDITYHIEWEVLNSDSVGPLVDLYVGIPNEHVDSLKRLSTNIKQIKYVSSANGQKGDYIYLSFTDKYYDGDIVEIDFSIHQSNMYLLSNNVCTYNFTPGWFNDVKIKKMKILWSNENVVDSNASKKDNTNLIWEKSLSKGEKIRINVEYNKSSFFGLDAENQYEEKNYNNSGESTKYYIACIVLFVFAIIVSMVTSSGRSYYSHRGFGYDDDDYYYRSRSHHRSYRSSSRPSRSSCACVSSCACACACAGGGRAGCSKKELYHIKIKNLKQVLGK